MYVSFECREIEVAETGQSVVQRSPTECGVSTCDLETSAMRRPKPNSVVKPGIYQFHSSSLSLLNEM